MFRWILSSVVALSFFAFSVTGSWALEVSYLDKNFERVKGKPLPQQVEFQASAGQGTLLLVNGGQNGSYRVSAATITLNGTVIVEPNAMNQNVSNLEVEVSLENQNLLVVELVSAPESFIDIAVNQEVQADAAGFVGTEGKLLEVVDSSSPLVGVSLEIPPDTMTEPALISVAEVETPPEAPLRGTIVGQAVELEPKGLTFETPIILTLPYNDKNQDGIVDGTSIDERYVSVGFYNEDTELWEQQKVISRDPQNNTVSAEIQHFSIYSPFVRVDNIIPQTTQLPPGVILVDGFSDDWLGLNLQAPAKPTLSEPDDQYDSTCGSGSDIKNVYTAMDATNVYIMIETWDRPIKPDMGIGLEIDIRPGKDLVGGTYGDIHLAFRASDYAWPNGTIGGSDSGDIYIHHNYGDADGIEVVKGDVLEAKIPLSDLKSNVTELLPAYFNITKITATKTGEANPCDVDEMYSKVNWFRFQKRIYGDKDDRVICVFSKISRAGVYLHSLDNIEKVDIKSPEENINITLYPRDLVSKPQFSAWGFYNLTSERFIYQDYLDENYFSKTYYEGEEEFVLQEGNYKFSLTTTDGDIYEAEALVRTTQDIPTVDSDTVNCHIHHDGEEHQENDFYDYLESQGYFHISEGDLYCDWEYPEYVNNPGFADVTEVIQVHPHFRAYQGDNMLRYNYPTIPSYDNEILDFAIVPAADLSRLVVGADKLTISVRTRVKSDSVRSYSAEKEINF